MSYWMLWDVVVHGVAAVVLLALDLVRSGMNITARCRESVLSALFAFVGSKRLWCECVLARKWA
ncbi:hypothetical protein [Paenibacillus sp. TSA_86.1]|uniref:hypothetical protein n=1 Tax=Paenibacillus sp. TSA_86.1 TaxID=3415649 RepID=UPI0040453269